MQILTVANCDPAEYQGSGYVIRNYCEGLRCLGHTVDLVSPQTMAAPRWLQRRRVIWTTLGMVAAVRACLRHCRYDVVEFYGGESWLAASLLHRLANRRFLLVAHSNGIEPFARATMDRHLGSGAPSPRLLPSPATFDHLAFRRVDALVTVSQIEAEFACAQGFLSSKRVLAIDNPLAASFLDQPIDLARPTTIGYCGSWLPRKGIAAMVRDLPPLLREFPGWTLRLIGVGEGFRVEEHFPADVARRIEVIPFIKERDRLRTEYHRLRILVVPSIYESFGLTLAEGMACGCAVVAGNTGFAASLVADREVCRMAEPGSPHLYTQVRRLMIDDGLRVTVARGGHRRVQSLRWEPAIRQLERAYLDWLAALREQDRSCVSDL